MSKRIAILYADGSLNVYSTQKIGGKTPLEHAKREARPKEGEIIVTFDLADDQIVQYAATPR